MKTALFVLVFVVVAAAMGAYTATAFGVTGMALTMLVVGMIGVALGVALLPRLRQR